MACGKETCRPTTRIPGGDGDVACGRRALPSSAPHRPPRRCASARAASAIGCGTTSTATASRTSARPGLIGVDLQLTDEWGRLVAETTTVADGLYEFGDLLPQSWTVSVVGDSLPDGYEPTYDFDGIGTAGSATTAVTGGQTRTDVDFGFRSAPVITWADPAPITFGTPLGPNQLNATADRAGTSSTPPPPLPPPTK